jgi:hypothetical protein
MRSIQLPELELERRGGATPEIFAAGGGAAVVRRAVVIGNGCAGAENQCLGLLRALGLADRLTLYVSSGLSPHFVSAVVILWYRGWFGCSCVIDSFTAVEGSNNFSW